MASRGERLSQAIKGRGITKMLPLAADLRVHESAISRWRKDGSMTLDNAVRLSEVLDVSLDWLILGRGDMDRHKGQAPRADETALVDLSHRFQPAALDHLVAFLKSVAPAE
jgi:transcriptional regulator with XRE-family HTH domain